MRPSATTRMAVQMALALGAAFVVGHLFFRQHWAWVVLTAFIVNSGNRGRLDVAYKSVLRVLGAALGTVLAISLAGRVGAHDAATVGLILSAVFLGIWLRPFGYAWWALFVTIALALLQGFEGGAAGAILWPRLEEIVVGALVGVAAAWLVLPVRSTTVLRGRLADVLVQLAEAFDPATAQRTAEPVTAAMARLEQVARAFRATRFATARVRPLRRAYWADSLLACEAPATALIAQGLAPAQVRRAIGAARKALREPATLQAALDSLRHSLETANEPSGRGEAASMLQTQD